MGFFFWSTTIHKIINARAEEALKTLDDNSIDAIITDPPYFKVKNLAWDKEHDKPETFLAWLDGVLAEYHRVLKPNGSLYVFASPRMSARVECLVAERFNVLNRITWAKPEPTSEINYGAGNGGRVSKESLRKYYPNTEFVVFAEHYGADNIAKGEAGYATKCDELRGFIFEPLRAYLVQEFKKANITRAEFNGICGFSQSSGGMASRHYLSASQWCLPTAEHYASLNAATGCFTRPYEELKQQYEELKQQYETLRRPFNATPNQPYTDVWTYPTVKPHKHKHPCEKPLEMMLDIINISTRDRYDTILDTFMGSGVVGKAAVMLNRNFIGVDMSPHWCDVAARNIEAVQPRLLEAAD